MSYNDNFNDIRVAGEDLEAQRGIKYDMANPGEVIYADAGDRVDGVTLESAKEGERVTFKSFRAPGSFSVEAGGTGVGSLAFGTQCMVDDDGIFTAGATNNTCALVVSETEAGGVSDGDYIEIIPLIDGVEQT
jgi:hypothetical protein